MDHLLRVVEHNRYKTLRRFDHLKTTDPSEGSDEFPMLKLRLSELDDLLRTASEKLDQVPSLKPAIISHVAQMRHSKYASVEAFAHSVLVSPGGTGAGLNLPTPQEQSALLAEKIIAEHRHKLPPFPAEKPINVHNDTTVAGTQFDVTGKQDKSVSLNPPKFGAHQVTSSADATTAIVDLETNRDVRVSVIQTAAMPKRSYRHVVIAVVCLFSGLIAVGIAFVAVRLGRRRARMRRAGYSQPVVEVDEVAENRSGLSRSTDVAGPRVQPVAQWRRHGYENFKYNLLGDESNSPMPR